MQSSKNESKNDAKKELISYEDWLKKSQASFKSPILKDTKNTFDEMDHKIASEKNQYIFDMLKSIANNKWYLPKIVDKTHKALQIWDFIKTIDRDVLHIDPLRASSYILLERIKLCLQDIKIIDASLIKNAEKNSIWFYELLQTQNITLQLDQIISQLDKQIKSYLEMPHSSLPPKILSIETSSSAIQLKPK